MVHVHDQQAGTKAPLFVHVADTEESSISRVLGYRFLNEAAGSKGTTAQNWRAHPLCGFTVRPYMRATSFFIAESAIGRALDFVIY